MATDALRKQTKDWFIECLKDPANSRCADCGAGDPQWASANLGLFICITCSGIHRNLGTHISRVKSLFLDNWTEDELKIMREIGNAKGLLLWEANLPPFYVKPVPEDSTPFKEQFIRGKYERKEFLDTSNKQAATGMVLKDGFLTKKGAVVKNWKKRWFVLRGSVLSYFKKPHEDLAAGEILISENIKCDACNELGTIENHHFCFELQTPNRNFLISAESARNMYEWIQAIRQARLRLHLQVSAAPPAALVLPAPSSSPRGDSKIDELAALVRADSTFEVRKHQGRDKKVYKDCFLGVELVDWILMNRRCASRPESVLMCKSLLERNFIACISGVQDFVDGRECYQWKK